MDAPTKDVEAKRWAFQIGLKAQAALAPPYWSVMMDLEAEDKGVEWILTFPEGVLEHRHEKVGVLASYVRKVLERAMRVVGDVQTFWVRLQCHEVIVTATESRSRHALISVWVHEDTDVFDLPGEAKEPSVEERLERQMREARVQAGLMEMHESDRRLIRDRSLGKTCKGLPLLCLSGHVDIMNNLQLGLK